MSLNKHKRWKLIELFQKQKQLVEYPKKSEKPYLRGNFDYIGTNYYLTSRRKKTELDQRLEKFKKFPRRPPFCYLPPANFIKIDKNHKEREWLEEKYEKFFGDKNRSEMDVYVYYQFPEHLLKEENRNNLIHFYGGSLHNG